MREIKFRAWDYDTSQMVEVRDIIFEPRIYINGETSNIHVMQYTGLKDKNGKEIYEGDIVKSQTPFDSWQDKLSIVKYEDGTWNYSYALHEFCDKPERAWEIIGNIYENPELLNT